MMNLSKRQKRPSGYVSVFTNVDTYYGHVCNFHKRRKVTVLATKAVWKKLQDLFELYKVNIPCYKRKLIAGFMRLSLNPKEENLERSYLFRMYCNGFNVAYKYFFFDNTSFMTTEGAIRGQIKAYLCSARVQALDFEPDEESHTIKEFAEYCFDLGQKAAAEYALAKFLLMEKKFNKVDSLEGFLKLDSTSNRPDDYPQKYAKLGLDFIKCEERNRSKRTAVFISFLNENADIKVRVPEDKNTAEYNTKIISLIWKEAHKTGVEVGDAKAKESFVKPVQRYLRGARKITEKDMQLFDKLLVEHNLR